MNRTRTAAVTLAAVLGVGTGGYVIAAAAQDSGSGSAPSDATEIDEVEGADEGDEAIDPARAAEATVTAAEAQAKATETTGGGTASEAVLEDEDGTLVFEIEVVDASGATTEVIVDATTGAATVDADDEADEADEDDDDIEHENEHVGADDPDEGHAD